MVILLIIYKYILRFTYIFFKLFKVKEKQILFLSRQSNNLTLDYELLINKINEKYPEYKCIVLTKRMDKTKISDIISYIFHPFKQMYYLATSRMCIVDGYQITVSILKHKKNLKIIQIWHSLAAIKKFGYESLKTKKDIRIAKVMCMHRNYDYIVSPSYEMSKLFSPCFKCDIDKFINIGAPKIDYLVNQVESNKKIVYKKYPELKKEKIVLYAPTFRISNHYEIDALIESFENSDYKLIIKPHSRMKCEYVDHYKDVSSYEMLSIADYLITDYSAILLDASIMNKKVLLYTYDYDEYKVNEGLNIDLKREFKKYCFDSPKAIIDFLNDGVYDLDVVKNFKNKYISSTDDITDKLADKLIEIIN